MKVFLALCVLGAAIYMTDATCTGDCAGEETARVCGVDGKWYNNVCELNCNQVALWQRSNDEGCNCPVSRMTPLMCGNDGNRYVDADHMRCLGVSPAADDSGCEPLPSFS